MTATRPVGGSVFLVEDEVMIRMMVADMLEELGYKIAAEAGEINEALKLVQSTEFDFASSRWTLATTAGSRRARSSSVRPPAQ